MQIIARKDAAKAGLGQYFTGKECKHGHISNRYTQSGACTACVAVAAAAGRGSQHSGVVVPRAKLEAERMEKVTAAVALRAEKVDALKRLNEIRVPIYPQDLVAIFETTTALCLAEFPCLDRADVYPDASPMTGTPLYRVMVPAAHIDTIRAVANEMWAAHPVDIQGRRHQIQRQAEQMADEQAAPLPEWKP